MHYKWFAPIVVTAVLVSTASAQSLSDRFQKFMGSVNGSDSTQNQNSAPDNKASQKQTQAQTKLPENKVAAGLKEALADGGAQAVAQLGQQGGFWDDPARRIPLPGWADKASMLLRGAGYGDQLDQLHLTMNRAAEQAIGEVGPIVRDTISDMSVADAYAILRGGDHAATEYLREHAGAALTDRVKPIVADATEQSTAANRYQSLLSSAKPLLSKAPGNLDLDLNNYVTNKALDGLFAVIAKQEAQIRANPVARGSDLLRAVFGGN